MRATNFITGAGGLLQAVHYGYGGLRYKEHQLDVRSWLLPGVTKWEAKSVHYKKWRLHLVVASADVTVTPQQNRDVGFEDMFVIDWSTQNRTLLVPMQSIQVTPGKVMTFVVRSELHLAKKPRYAK